MRVTTDHPASSYGQPVILDDSGQVVDYATGIKAIRDKAGLTTMTTDDLPALIKERQEARKDNPYAAYFFTLLSR